MIWKPNKWIAVLLSFFVAPLAFLYVGAPWLAVLAFGLMLPAGFIVYFYNSGAFESLFTVAQFVYIAACMALSYRLASSTLERGVRPWYSRWYGQSAIAACVVLVTLLVRICLYEPFRIPSSSMAPTADAGTNILVQKWGFGHLSAFGMRFGQRPISTRLERGDVIVFDYPVDPRQTYIKRLVGLPGDKIIYRKKHLLINGVDTRVRQLEDYLDAAGPRYFERFQERIGSKEFEILINSDTPSSFPPSEDFRRTNMCAFEQEEIRCDVPAGNYFVLGDNRDNSLDSRIWGFVKADHVVGKVVHLAK